MFSESCRGIPAPLTGPSSPSLSPLTSVSTWLFLSCFSHSSFVAAVQNFLLFLKKYFSWKKKKVLPSLLIGSALAVLFSQKSPLQPSSLSKPCHVNPVQKKMSNVSCLICFCFRSAQCLTEKVVRTQDRKSLSGSYWTLHQKAVSSQTWLIFIALNADKKCEEVWEQT